MSVIAGLLLALFLLLAALVLVAVLVCLLLVAALALVVLLERTGTDVSGATAGLRERLRSPRDAIGPTAPAGGRLPWSRRKPTPGPDGGAPAQGAEATDAAPAPVAAPDAAPAARPAAGTTAARRVTSTGASPRARAVRTTAAQRATTTAPAAPAEAPQDEAPTERLPVAPATEERAAPATRTRPIRRPKPVAAPEAAGDREAAMERLFAPLTETDRTEPLPRPQEQKED